MLLHSPRTVVLLASLLSSGCSVLVDDELSEKASRAEARELADAGTGEAAAASLADAALAVPDPADGSSSPHDVDATLGNTQPEADAGRVPSIAPPKLCVGQAHACALSSAGEVRCWGSNLHQQRTLEGRSERFLELSCGGLHTCAITEQHTVVCVGSNTDKQTLGAPTDSGYVQIAAGALHTCARKADGRATCWGGYNSSYGEASAPVDEFITLAAGEQVSCGVLKLDGSLKCWGSPDAGRNKPPAGIGYLDLSLGGGLGCAIDKARELRCWGAMGSLAPPLLTVQKLSVGGEGRGCALLESGLTCWHGGGQKLLGVPYSSFAVGPTAICSLPVDGSQLVCDTDSDDDPIKDVPRPYPG